MFTENYRGFDILWPTVFWCFVGFKEWGTAGSVDLLSGFGSATEEGRMNFHPSSALKGVQLHGNSEASANILSTIVLYVFSNTYFLDIFLKLFFIPRICLRPRFMRLGVGKQLHPNVCWPLWPVVLAWRTAGPTRWIQFVKLLIEVASQLSYLVNLGSFICFYLYLLLYFCFCYFFCYYFLFLCLFDFFVCLYWLTWHHWPTARTEWRWQSYSLESGSLKEDGQSSE